MKIPRNQKLKDLSDLCTGKSRKSRSTPGRFKKPRATPLLGNKRWEKKGNISWQSGEFSSFDLTNCTAAEEGLVLRPYIYKKITMVIILILFY